MRYLCTLVRRKISLACLCLCSKIITKTQNWWNDSGARPQVQQTFHNNSKQEGTDAGGTDDTHSDEPVVLTQLLSQETTWWLNATLHEMSTDRNKWRCRCNSRLHSYYKLFKAWIRSLMTTKVDLWLLLVSYWISTFTCSQEAWKCQM